MPGLSKVVSTEPSEFRCTSLLRTNSSESVQSPSAAASPPTHQKSPPTYQPPRPSGITSYTVPFTLGNVRFTAAVVPSTTPPDPVPHALNAVKRPTTYRLPLASALDMLATVALGPGCTSMRSTAMAGTAAVRANAPAPASTRARNARRGRGG